MTVPFHETGRKEKEADWKNILSSVVELWSWRYI